MGIKKCGKTLVVFKGNGLMQMGEKICGQNLLVLRGRNLREGELKSGVKPYWFGRGQIECGVKPFRF